MNENMKNGLLWAAAALGVLWLIQGLLKGLTGLFMGGFGGRDMGMGHGKAFGGYHGMGGGMPHGGYEQLASLLSVVIVVIIALVVWVIVNKKKKSQNEQLVETVEVQSAKEEDIYLTEKSVQVNDVENNTSEVNDSNNEVK